MKKPYVLCILDGWGYNPDSYGNAVAAAATPNLDRLTADCPNTLIGASGMDVGLPHGQMGNSEVGHTNIGAGRIVYQELTRISNAIESGEFFDNPVLRKAVTHALENNTALHLYGLLSDGGVHSSNTHLYALLQLAKKMGLTRVFVHCLLDGRDVSPTSGAGYINQLLEKMSELGIGKISTVMGRYYAMDRDNRWERVNAAYSAMVYARGKKCNDPVAAVKESYTQTDNDGKLITDEFVVPLVCCEDGSISPNDSVICFNFRPDRAREITRTLVDPDFDGFTREKGFFPLFYVCMTQYDESMPNVEVAFTPQSLSMTLGEYLSTINKTQLRIAETEKYAHVTFFFNGGIEQPYKGESRILVPSPKVATYDLQPQMSAYEVTDKTLAAIQSGEYDVIILNFANCDMVGHTGVFDAAVAAVETVDACTAKVAAAVIKAGGVMLITADHGNADKMYEADGSPFTAHTTNAVPLIAAGYNGKLKPGGKLCDLVPTLLDIMGIEIPSQMSGKSLALH